MELSQKEPKEQKIEENDLVYGVKKRNLLITLGIILVCIFMLRCFRSNLEYKYNTLKGGVSQVTSNILFSTVSSFRNLSGNCMNGTFTNSLDRVKYMIDTLLAGVAIVIAIILIPAFPIVMYIIIIYLVISKLFIGMGNI